MISEMMDLIIYNEYYYRNYQLILYNNKEDRAARIIQKGCNNWIDKPYIHVKI